MVTSSNTTSEQQAELNESKELKTVFEKIPLRPKDKRKRERNDQPEDIEGFLGPWGGYIDEEKVSRPNEVRFSKIIFFIFVFLSIAYNNGIISNCV